MNVPKIEEIENCLHSFLNGNKNYIVPNVSWGAGLHECDLLVITPLRYAYEIEIKRSLSDLRNDFKKPHRRFPFNKKLKKLYYAVDKSFLDKSHEIIPRWAGIIKYERVYSSIDISKCWTKCTLIREAKENPGHEKWTDKQVTNVLRLSNMRFWNTRKKVL